MSAKKANTRFNESKETSFKLAPGMDIPERALKPIPGEGVSVYLNDGRKITSVHFHKPVGTVDLDPECWVSSRSREFGELKDNRTDPNGKARAIEKKAFVQESLSKQPWTPVSEEFKSELIELGDPNPEGPRFWKFEIQNGVSNLKIATDETGEGHFLTFDVTLVEQNSIKALSYQIVTEQEAQEENDRIREDIDRTFFSSNYLKKQKEKFPDREFLPRYPKEKVARESAFPFWKRDVALAKFLKEISKPYGIEWTLSHPNTFRTTYENGMPQEDTGLRGNEKQIAANIRGFLSTLRLRNDQTGGEASGDECDDNGIAGIFDSTLIEASNERVEQNPSDVDLSNVDTKDLVFELKKRFFESGEMHQDVQAALDLIETSGDEPVPYEHGFKELYDLSVLTVFRPPGISPERSELQGQFELVRFTSGFTPKFSKVTKEDWGKKPSLNLLAKQLQSKLRGYKPTS